MSSREVNLRPGTVSGSNEIISCPLGADNQYILCVGREDQEMDIFVQRMLDDVLSRFTAKEVNLWLLDYDNDGSKHYAEFEEHVNTDIYLHGQNSKAVQSMYNWLKLLIEKRVMQFSKANVDNITQWNKMCEEDGKPEDVMPRILFVHTNMQEIFNNNTASMDIDQYIRSFEDIAAAVGVHIIWVANETDFLSHNTLKHFKTRVILRCSETTSDQLLGGASGFNLGYGEGYLLTKNARDDWNSQKFDVNLG